MKLTKVQIDKIVSKYAPKPGFRELPVRNFLGSLPASGNAWEASMNLAQDAKAYNWKPSIVAAIKEGIRLL